LGGGDVMLTAKIFWNGKSQAVRLPKECRFNSDEVYIRKTKKGILLSQKPKADWNTFFSKHEPCPDFKIDRLDNTSPQTRDLF